MMRVIISGPSASGKDYLYKSLIDKYDYKPCIKYTTRPKREGEVDGFNYLYVNELYINELYDNGSLLTKQEFNIKVNNSDTYTKWIYAIECDKFENSNISIMTPYEINTLNETILNKSIIIYLNIDANIIRDRLINRFDNNDSIDRRMSSDLEDFKDFHKYDISINDPNFNVLDVYNRIQTCIKIKSKLYQ